MKKHLIRERFVAVSALDYLIVNPDAVPVSGANGGGPGCSGL